MTEKTETSAGLDVVAQLPPWATRIRAFAGRDRLWVVGGAASFLSEHYGAPVMLFALLLGMAMNFLSAEGACQPGIEFAGRAILRVGIALLGLRITVSLSPPWDGNRW